MSLLSSLYTSTSGLATSSLDLSVIGDNIANANTIGFKGSRAAFEAALAQRLIGGAGEVGLGARLQAVQRILTAGALVNTGLATDLAIDGDGFFLVKGAHQGRDGTWYTRAGQFTLDAQGYLVNLEGLRVQGYGADASGAITGALGDLLVGEASSPPRATQTITVRANLQADAQVPPAWDLTDPSGTSNFSTSVTVYDSLGIAHQVSVYFRKNSNGDWEWHALADGGGLTGGSAGTAVEIGTGTLSFDGEGRLSGVTGSARLDPLGALQGQALTFNFGDALSNGGTGLAGMTQFAAPSAVTFLNQDGWSPGELASVRVDPDGSLVGTFSNGQTRTLGQVALARFAAADQLRLVGGNLFAPMPRAGNPVVGAPGQGGRGSIVAGALEQSNVDLATEFVRLMAAQRAFQANARVITTADQLLVDLMSLRR